MNVSASDSADLHRLAFQEARRLSLEDCLRRARQAGERHLRGLSNAQLSGLVALANDQSLTLERVLAQLDERSAKRWADEEGAGPLPVMKRHIEELGQVAERVLRTIEDALGELVSEWPSRDTRERELHLDLVRRYLTAAVDFCRANSARGG